MQMKLLSLNECKYVSIDSDQESPLEMCIPLVPAFTVLWFALLGGLGAHKVDFLWTIPNRELRYSSTSDVLQVLKGVWFMDHTAAHPT